jgi:hypothetical protein
MSYISLIVAIFCTFAALYQFEGSFLDAGIAALAVANFGLFIALQNWHAGQPCNKPQEG